MHRLAKEFDCHVGRAAENQPQRPVHWFRHLGGKLDLRFGADDPYAPLSGISADSHMETSASLRTIHSGAIA